MRGGDLMNRQDLPDIMRGLRRAPLHSDATAAFGCDDGEAAVERALPHRPPFLFVDRVVGFDPERRTLLARRYVDPSDPIFRGHFPGAPVFPAALQIEAIGQACLCLWSLAVNGGQPTHLGLRVTRVEQAQFLSPVLPDQTMQLHAQLLAADELLVTAAGQVFVEDRLCSVLIINVAIVDG
jgi:3-hydroxymyristoyl/3-hydroxydecanoyl-(acyl carrier protein) dehydratase